jgi:hypothetical protein
MPTRQRYTQKQVIDALHQYNGLIGPAAKALGCDRSTIENYVERYPKVKEAKLAEREFMLDLGEAALVRAVRAGEGWAVQFMLRMLGKERGFVERVEQRVELEVYVRQRAQELGLNEEEALEAVRPRLMLKAG